MDQVNVRLDGDVASILKSDAERTGVSMSSYLNDLLRRTLRENKEPRPMYIPPGRAPESIAAFKANSNNNRRYVWIFRDLLQPVIWMLPAELEAAHDLSVVVRPPGGRSLSVPLDNLVSWTLYSNDHERLGLMHHWYNAGAAVHPWCTDSFRPS